MENLEFSSARRCATIWNFLNTIYYFGKSKPSNVYEWDNRIKQIGMNNGRGTISYQAVAGVMILIVWKPVTKTT